jgi:hypothetical protein
MALEEREETLVNENYILCILLGVSVILNLVLFVVYKIWRNRAKKSIRGTLYLMDDEMYSEFKVNLEDLYAMDTVTLKVVSASQNRKE